MSNLKFDKIEYEDEIGDIIYSDFITPYRKGYIIIGNEKICLTECYADYMESIENFEIFNSDVLVASHPKAGTTWTQEMVWMICNNLNFEKGKTAMQERFPFLEICGIYDQNEMNKAMKGTNPECVGKSIEFVKQLNPPRFIKTHLSFSLLPKQIRDRLKTPKIIYVTRNSKDTCISYYHHAKLLEGYRGNFENFCKVFLAGKTLYGPFWKHVISFWEKRHWNNILILRYEDMIKDLHCEIRKVAMFLNKPVTEDQIELLSSHLSLNSMRKNEAVNFERVSEIRKAIYLNVENGKFLRSGTVGQYKTDIPADLLEKFEKLAEESIVGSDLTLNDVENVINSIN